MGLGNRNAKSGNKGSNFNWEFRMLQALGEIVTTTTPPPGGLATEATALNILAAINASNQDIEVLLVRDTGNGDVVVKQIQELVGGAISYEDVNGAPYVPVGPLQYLDPSAVLNLMLTEMLDQGLTLDSMETLLTTIDTVLDNIKLDTANLDVALSTRASEATLLSTNALLTTIDAVLDTIKTDTVAIAADTAAMVIDLAAIEALITTTNSLLTQIDTVLDSIKVDTGVLATPITGLATSLTNAVAAGSVAAGKRRVSFHNESSTINATVAGGTLKPGKVVTFSADGLRDVLGAIAYDPGVGGELLISTVG